MIEHLEKLHALRCSICEDVFQIHRKDVGNPERLAELKELVEIDHAECEQYKQDAWKAKQARRFRTRRLKLLRQQQNFTPGVRI